MYIQTYNVKKLPSGIKNLPDSHPVANLIIKEVKDKVEKYLKKLALGENPRKPDALKYKTIWIDEEAIKVTRNYVDQFGKLNYSFISQNSKTLNHTFIYVRPLKDRKEDLITLKGALKEEEKHKTKTEKDAKIRKTDS